MGRDLAVATTAALSALYVIGALAVAFTGNATPLAAAICGTVFALFGWGAWVILDHPPRDR